MSPRAGARIFCVAAILLNLITAALTWPQGWPILNLVVIPIIVGIAIGFEYRWRQDDRAQRRREKGGPC